MSAHQLDDEKLLMPNSNILNTVFLGNNAIDLMNLLIDYSQYSGVFTTIIFVVKTLVNLHKDAFMSKEVTDEVVQCILNLEDDKPFGVEIAKEIEHILREPIILKHMQENPMQLIGQDIFANVLKIAKHYDGIREDSVEDGSFVVQKLHKMGGIMVQLTGIHKKALTKEVLDKYQNSLLVVAVDLRKCFKVNEEKSASIVQLELDGIIELLNDGNFNDVLLVLTHVDQFFELADKHPLEHIFPGIPDAHEPEEGTTKVLEFFYNMVQGKLKKGVTLFRNFLLSQDVAQDFYSFSNCIWHVQKLRIQKEEFHIQDMMKEIRARARTVSNPATPGAQ
jgi:hypothetical protein